MSIVRAMFVFLAVLALPLAALAQPKAPVKVRYTEIARSIMYAPAYVALSKGYLREAGLDVSFTTTFEGDKVTAALLSGVQDIALTGPNFTFYVAKSESPTKLKIFCGLVATDGFVLVSRAKIDKFDWSMLRGKEILSTRAGQTPALFLEAALKKHGIDPAKDVKLVGNVPFPARLPAWLSGQNQFAIFLEPDVSMLERDGKGHEVASIGAEVGNLDYTVFVATDTYIKQNPQVVQAWTDAIYRAQKFTETASTAELVKILAEFFPGVEAQLLGKGVERYKKYRIWKTSPLVEPKAIEGLQDVLVLGGVLDKAKRVTYEEVVAPQFARQAKP